MISWLFLEVRLAVNHKPPVGLSVMGQKVVRDLSWLTAHARHSENRSRLLLALAGFNGDNRQLLRGNDYSEGEATSLRKFIMGDRSPKSAQKQASQKQSKTDAVSQKKNALITSRQATKAKAAAAKRK